MCVSKTHGSGPVGIPWRLGAQEAVIPYGGPAHEPVRGAILRADVGNDPRQRLPALHHAHFLTRECDLIKDREAMGLKIRCAIRVHMSIHIVISYGHFF